MSKLQAWQQEIWDLLQSGGEIKFPSQDRLRRQHKSQLFATQRAFAEANGEKLPTSTFHGMKAEQYRMSDGKIHAFISMIQP